MKSVLPLILLLLVSTFSAGAQTLPATTIMRAAGPAENLNHYKAGYISVGKAMAGQSGELHWKAFIIFDVVSAVEDLAQKPDATLKLPFDWIKSADDVQDLSIYYVGCLPKVNLVDQDMWKIFLSNQGTEVGGIKAHELAGLKSRQFFEFDLKDKIASGEVTPVNRYMVFRIESKPFENPEGNGLVGLSPDLSAYALVIDGADEQTGGTTGGY